MVHDKTEVDRVECERPKIEKQRETEKYMVLISSSVLYVQIYSGTSNSCIPNVCEYIHYMQYRKSF